MKLRTTNLDPSTPPAVAQRIFVEDAGDLKAQWILNRLAEEVYNDGAETNSRKLMGASASLVHAFHYLEDRDEYAANPWPKNMIKFAMEPRRKCEHHG